MGKAFSLKKDPMIRILLERKEAIELLKRVSSNMDSVDPQQGEVPIWLDIEAFLKRVE